MFHKCLKLQFESLNTLKNITFKHCSLHSLSTQHFQCAHYHFRSLLFIPGNSEKMLSKMYTLDQKPDVFVPDLEDSVPYSKKLEARDILTTFLKANLKKLNEQNTNINEIFQRPGNSILIPRVNSEAEYFEGDVRALLEINSLFQSLAAQFNTKFDSESISYPIHAFTVGKTQNAQDVDKYNTILTMIENDLGLPKHSVKLIPTIESAMAILNVKEIATTCPERVIGLAFGADDYAHDMGFTRDTEPQIKGEVESESELSFARQLIGVAARATHIQALDTPNVNFKDPKAHLREAKHVRRMGFTGKFAIHPSQINEIHQVFGVTKKEYEEALKIVKAYEVAVRENSRGSLQIDGRMIDQPVLKQYQRVIEAFERN